MKPVISVIIPTYNRAVLVMQAVQSVLAQPFSHYEVIVVDDGSTDQTEEALAPFMQRPNFRYYCQPNSGRSAARNRGIEVAAGEFLLFLDSDDLLLPGAFEHLWRGVAQHPEAAMIAGGSRFVDESLSELYAQTPALKMGLPATAYPKTISKYVLLQGSFLVRRSVARELGGYDPATEPCEDYDFALRIAMRCQIACVSDVVVQCLKHDANTPSTDLFRGAIRVAQKHLKLLDGTSGLPPDTRRQSKAKWALKMADNYYALGDNARALKNYLWALSLEPAGMLRLRVPRQILASLVPVPVRESVRLRRARRARLTAA